MARKPRATSADRARSRPARIGENPEKRRPAPRKGRENRPLPNQNTPDSPAPAPPGPGPLPGPPARGRWTGQERRRPVRPIGSKRSGRCYWRFPGESIAGRAGGTRPRWRAGGPDRPPRRGPGPAAGAGRPRRRGPARGPCPPAGRRGRRRRGGARGGAGRAGPRPSRQSRSRPIRTAAALLLPPPRPPATGIRLVIVMVTPFGDPREPPQLVRRAVGEVRRVGRDARVVAADLDRRGDAAAARRRREG